MKLIPIIVKWTKHMIIFVFVPLFVLSATICLTAYFTIGFFKNMSANWFRLSLPNSIDVLEPVEIGGIKQWISIRGHNKDAPILLYVHGGPGSSIIQYAHEMTYSWEEYFTVVVWDQRGCGKSYYPTEKIADTMTVDRFIDDTGEVIDYLRKRFNREKIFLMGHSWGSILGINIAKRHPDRLYAYIGIGQVVNSIEAKRLTYHLLLELFESKNDQANIKRLKDMAPYPDDADMPVLDYFKNHYKCLDLAGTQGKNERHQMTDNLQYKLTMLSILLRSHTVSLSGIYRNNFAGDNPNNLASFKRDLLRTDIPVQVGHDFEVPIFFVCGRHDWQVPYQMSVDYFQKIKAPYKELLMLEDSAHLLQIEEPGKMLNLLVTKVLPIATAPGL